MVGASSSPGAPSAGLGCPPANASDPIALPPASPKAPRSGRRDGRNSRLMTRVLPPVEARLTVVTVGQMLASAHRSAVAGRYVASAKCWACDPITRQFWRSAKAYQTGKAMMWRSRRDGLLPEREQRLLPQALRLLPQGPAPSGPRAARLTADCFGPAGSHR